MKRPKETEKEEKDYGVQKVKRDEEAEKGNREKGQVNNGK